MNVASLENCKRLYELSAWGHLSPACNDETDFVYYSNGGEVNGDFAHYRQMVFEKDGNIPAYDAGYLLRKLPYMLEHKTGRKFLQVSIGAATAIARYGGVGQASLGQTKRAYTPEDALALLAITLIEKGILNPVQEKQE